MIGRKRSATMKAQSLKRKMKEQKWVPIVKRLPKTGRGVLLFADIAGGIQTVARLEDDGVWRTVGDIPIPSVTHWQYLPESPVTP